MDTNPGGWTSKKDLIILREYGQVVGIWLVYGIGHCDGGKFCLLDAHNRVFFDTAGG
ncbi:hypothetical protein KDA_34170 [Dictyobacter alpinus]|uniref:Uncharacterized protein n=1 Tax=Dictyobacter alpinus TaxID=2014873 RepID=A0A402B951_9CHLR|nr:hypothetical protein KDA_34170 [Dictyobacter alpinus]